MFLFPCLKLARRPKQAHTSLDCGLQNSSYIAQIGSRLRSSFDNHQYPYWSMPKSPPQVMTFLHFWCSGSATSSHCRVFSHFKHHFKNLWLRASLTVQSISGPSMCGMNMFGIASCALEE